MSDRLESTQKHHISQQFNTELQHVHNQVLSMGGLVHQQLNDALIALEENDGGLAEQVYHNDYKVNAMEVHIDEACVQIIALRQPAASDLRLVVALIKTISDLERIGDEAKRIARMAVHKSSEAYLTHPQINIENISGRVKGMLQGALDAFARMDVDSAFEIIQRDTKVDQAYNSMLRELVTYMMSDPRSIPTAMDIMWSIRSLERIGDRAKNICEYIIYFVKGKDIRHTSPENVEQQVKIDIDTE